MDHILKAILQRVRGASVRVEGKIVSQIGPGLLVLLGVTHSDSEREADWMAAKIVNLRIFNDSEGKMNRSLRQQGGEILAVSQFTLYADCRKGRRPSFIAAASPERGEKLYEYFCRRLSGEGVSPQRGIFGAEMEVKLVNDGPVTIILEKSSG